MPESIAVLMDCIKYMKQFPDKYFDLADVDPPYGIGQYWMKQKHTYHFGKSNWNERAPTAAYFKQLFRVSKNQIIWGGNYFTKHLPVTNSWIVWDKGSDVKKMNTSECEMAWTSFKIPMRKVFIQWSGGRKGIETGIKNIHPCQRPVQLHSWLFSEYTEPGMKILDTHLGSGSSRIAAHNYGLDFYSCEIDEQFFDKQEKRYLNHIKQQTLTL